MSIAKSKLGLHLPTDPRWVNLAEIDLEEILTDHAYCEQKAATSCITIIQKFPDYEDVVRELAPIVSEEWSHFRLVLKELDKRGLKLGRQRRDDYVNALMNFCKKDGSRNDALVERLLVFALIEARSAERFRLLSLDISDDNLKEFYRGFMLAEAEHYKMFLGLAKKHGGEEKVSARWQEYLAEEVKILANIETRGDRMH